MDDPEGAGDVLSHVREVEANLAFPDGGRQNADRDARIWSDLLPCYQVRCRIQASNDGQRNDLRIV